MAAGTFDPIKHGALNPAAQASEGNGPALLILQALGVPMADFLQLAKIPIIIYYGDNIPDEPTQNPGQEQWRAVAMAKQWRVVVNKHGGDVNLIRLPEIDFNGNTHFPVSDLNNVAVADLVSQFLKSKGLD